MYPLIAYDIARQRHTELIAEAHRHRSISAAELDGRPASHTPMTSVLARLRRALRTLTNVTKAHEHRTTAIVLAAAGVSADGRSATTPLEASPARPTRAERCDAFVPWTVGITSTSL